jgi:RNA polymerase sigma-70 factor (ECF subfamily)
MSASLTRDELAEALGRAGAGDRVAFRRVYEATSAKLMGVCLRILHDRQLAEDVLQDTYVTVWRKADRFDASRASPITWLVTIARNRAIDRLRSGGALRRAAPVEAALDLADDARDSVVRMAGGDARRALTVLEAAAGVALDQARQAGADDPTYSHLRPRRHVSVEFSREDQARLQASFAAYGQSTAEAPSPHANLAPNLPARPRAKTLDATLTSGPAVGDPYRRFQSPTTVEAASAPARTGSGKALSRANVATPNSSRLIELLAVSRRRTETATVVDLVRPTGVAAVPDPADSTADVGLESDLVAEDGSGEGAEGIEPVSLRVTPPPTLQQLRRHEHMEGDAAINPFCSEVDEAGPRLRMQEQSATPAPSPFPSGRCDVM